MKKVYRYKDITFSAGDDDEVNFSVELVSDGNDVLTTIDVPGPYDSEIPGAGGKFIGKGSELREGTSLFYSSIDNPVPEEDTIHVKYKLNGQVIVDHNKPKSEAERQVVIIFMRFPQP